MVVTVLAIDIGNTNTAIGVFKNDELKFVSEISTFSYKTEFEYAVILQSVLNLYKIDLSSVNGAVISSVVPQLNNIMKTAINFAFGVKAVVVGPGVKTGLNIHCDVPSSVGADLICSALAVNKLYTYPAIILDMGTATKISLVDQNGAFVGVSIMPGVNAGLGALVEGTAQLPQISLDLPRTVIGKNTTDSMRSGIIYGNAAMIDGMIDRICVENGADLPVIATGEFTPLILRYCSHEVTFDKDLVLKGLYLIYKKNV